MALKYFAALLLPLCISQTALAQSLVLGNGKANACYLSVRHGDQGRVSTIRTCEEALGGFDISHKDKAATHVNLGILYMRAGNNVEARKHYDMAINMTPNLPEAYINNGAALIYMGRHEQAVEAINKAIGLGTKKMPEALFNRAMAYDHLKKYDHAYKDLKQALVLRPDWKPALRAIDNYEVTTAPSN